MKKIIPLLLVMLLALTACKKEEHKQEENNVNVSNDDQNSVDNNDETEDDATGDETTEDDATGDETTEDDATGDETTGDETTGDETTEGDTTEDDATEDEIAGEDDTTEEEIQYAEAIYEYKTSQLGTKQLYVENGEVKEVKDAAIRMFSATYTYAGKAYEVEFGYLVIGEHLILNRHMVYEEPDAWVGIERIPGRTDKVLIYFGVQREGNYGYQICDLATNSIEPLLNGMTENGKTIETIQVFGDLSKAIVQYMDGEIRYYDVNGEKDVKKFFSEIEWTLMDDYVIRFTEKGLLLECFDRKEESGVSYYLHCYSYDFFTNETIKTVDGKKCTINDNQPNNLAQYGGLFDTYYASGSLVIVELTTGREIVTDIQYVTVSNIQLIDNKYFLVIKKDKTVDMVYAKNGRIVGSLGKIDIKSRGSALIIASDEDIYIEVTASDYSTKKIYRIEVYL